MGGREARWTIGSVVAVVLLVAGALVVGTRGDAAGRPRITGPDQWDRRVVDLVDFVERERGLRFDHPVAVSFLDDAAFVERVAGTEEPTEEELEELEHFAAAYRAIGLLEGDVDLFAATQGLVSGSVVGLYDPDVAELVVRGEDLDEYTRATVVHELTHALQDQRFGLDRLGDDELGDGPAQGLRSLVEADASWVEQRWVAGLDGRATRAYHEQQAALLAAAGDDLEDVPAALSQAFSFPYTFGPALVAVLQADGGNDAVDDAYDDPPVSDEQILFPGAYLDGDDPDPVELGDAAGDEVVDEDDFGAFTLFQLLVSRLDYAPSLAAVEGWGGDRYRITRRDDQVCVTLVVRGDTERDLDELVAALTDWADGLAGAAVEPDGDVVVLRSCDPGGTPFPPSRHRTEAGDGFTALAYRAAIVEQLVRDAGIPRQVAECVGEGFVEVLGVDRLAELDDEATADPGGAPPPEVGDALLEAYSAC